jgi:hypothetical protein
MIPQHGDALASLTDAQRRAMCDALIEWHAVARAEGYEPDQLRTGFSAYLVHSAALRRLMAGLPLFVERPPLTAGSYPDYGAMENAGAALRVRPADADIT